MKFFTKRLFWDVDVNSLNVQKDQFFIIERVMNYGLWQDFVELIQFYGKETV